MSTILVTGATGAIGTNVCHYLAKKNHVLILGARDVSKLDSLSRDLREKYGANVTSYSFDFSSIETIDALALSLHDQKIDGLVLMPPQLLPTDECIPEPEVMEEMHKVSFIGPAILIKRLLPNLIANKSSVVMISGISSVQPLSHYATSNVLRTSCLGLMKTLADKYGPEGVRFNTLSLGGVLTEPYKKKLEQEASISNIEVCDIYKQRVSNVPLRRYALPNEIANMLDVILTQDAGLHMTGQNIKFDGGFTRPY